MPVWPIGSNKTAVKKQTQERINYRAAIGLFAVREPADECPSRGLYLGQPTDGTSIHRPYDCSSKKQLNTVKLNRKKCALWRHVC